MQEKGSFAQKRAAAALLLVLLVVTQQVCASPVPNEAQYGSARSSSGSVGVLTLRRTARMTPLWRLMNSKPSGAYCQNNYECSTGFCKAGRCSTSRRSPAEPVNY
ncbi:liver-expressed antimicrobial peptide 2 [Genypterus blacodes]|uniref:liver-expressed antimicrobial peptide 2 n=1 Tax=Genypterus blacodes TaxID=154954 RepID=UPI003F767681